MEKIEKLNSSELKAILKWLKLYSDLTKKLWNRWRSIFNNKLSGQKSYKVEYTSALWKDSAWEKSKLAFKKAFWEKPKKENVSFVINNDIFGGIKIFEDDNMVDLSLSKAIDQIK